MTTTTRRTPETRSIAPPMPFHALAGNHPVGQVAAFRDLHRAQNRQVDVPAANHGKRVGAGKDRRAGNEGHGLLARIDQVGVDLRCARKRPHAQQSILRLQVTVISCGNVVGNQRRNADAEVHIEAVFAAPARRAPPSVDESMPRLYPSRVVLFSMRFSGCGLCTSRCTKIPGV